MQPASHATPPTVTAKKPHSARYLVLVGLAALACVPASACEALATLERTEGAVKVQLAEQAFALRSYDLPYKLCAGDKVFTLSGAQALIKHQAGEIVLDAESNLSINSKQQLLLNNGQLLFDVTPVATKQKPIEVKTPLVVVGIKGTRFILNAQQHQNELALFSGSVQLERNDRQSLVHYSSDLSPKLAFTQQRQQMRQEMAEFKQDKRLDFAALVQLTQASLVGNTKRLNLKPGRQVKLGQDDGKQAALETNLTPRSQRQHDRLASWLPQ